MRYRYESYTQDNRTLYRVVDTASSNVVSSFIIYEDVAKQRTLLLNNRHEETLKRNAVNGATKPSRDS